MGSRHIGAPRKTKPKHNLTSQQRLFVELYLANGMNGAAAAREAGYAAANQRALRLLQHPGIQAHINHRLTELQDKIDIQRQDLVNIMKRVLTFNTMRIGKATRDGFIEIDAEEYERVADEIGDLVVETEFRVKEVEDDDGSTTRRGTVRIKLMSKDKMFELAMKYKGLLKPDGTTLNVNTAMIPFDELCTDPDTFDADPVEALIEDPVHGGAAKKT